MKKQRKRRVLIVIPSLQGGGEERGALHLVNTLDRARFEPILALGDVSGPYLKDVRSDVVIHHLGGEHARSVVPQIVSAVWKHRPHTVFSLLGFNFAVTLARGLFPSGTRVVIRQGNTTTAYLDEVKLSSPRRAAFYNQAFRKLYRRADRVICQCDYMLHDLADNYALPRRKLKSIYNSVDFNHIEKLTQGDQSPYKTAGPNIVTVGNMLYAKGYDLLLPAFRQVRDANPTATLTFVGQGDNRPKLEALTRELKLEDAVHFAGFQDNPFTWLKHADLFVSSSRYEGFAFVILEALGCGTPVVATDCPSGNREVIDEGVNGWLARVGDVDSLAQTLNRALTKIATLDRAQIAARCRERFSHERIAREYERQF